MPLRGIQSLRLRRLFMEGFLAMDIAEPLVSFDAEAEARSVYDFMVEKDFDLVGVRRGGLVNGYTRREDLINGICLDHMRPLSPDDDLRRWKRKNRSCRQDFKLRLRHREYHVISR